MPSSARPYLSRIFTTSIRTLALALIAGGLVSACGGDDAAQTEPDAVAIAKPGGVVTFEITGRGLFTATPAGDPIGTATYESLAHDGHVATAADSVPSPDGESVARIDRLAGGVFLSVARPDQIQQIANIAGPDDAALVAGGKGAARAVAGVPLVVAWSPDSSVLAFGSITGEPYTLNLGYPDMDGATRSYQVTGGYVGELAFSPDGRFLAISTYALDRATHSVILLDLTTDRLVRLIDGCHITWSPDSKYVAIHRDPGDERGAWVVSVTDSSERWAISSDTNAFPLTWTI